LVWQSGWSAALQEQTGESAKGLPAPLPELLPSLSDVADDDSHALMSLHVALSLQNQDNK
jgi:hypothetical protein